jgi:amidase
VAAELNAQPGEDPPLKPSSFHTKHLTTYQLWKAHEREGQLREDYLDYWQSSRERTGTGRAIDALTSPVASFAAPPHANNNNCNYTMTFNALNYPAIAFSVTTVDQQLDRRSERTQFLNEAGRANQEMYDAITFRDAPVGL